MTTRKWILSMLAAVSVSAAAYAHHSIAGVYDGSRELKVEGVVTLFQFINPHPFLTIDVATNGAPAQLWRLEMDNRSELTRIGMTDQTYKPGDRVVVTGSPGRSTPQTLYIRQLDRAADGFRYEQIGGTPRINNRPRR